ncbi:MAG: hydrolase [Bacteroidota bacterium]
METEKKALEVCCPRFDPAPWDDKMLEWKDKKFVKEKVFTLFYMPLNFAQVMRRLDKKLRASGVEYTDAICLSYHTSMWNMDLYLSVDKEVMGVENTVLSGNYYSRVYEGPFKDTGKWSRDFAAYAQDKGMTLEKNYMWYTTCPGCAKKYGKNYVVLMGKLQNSKMPA